MIDQQNRDCRTCDGAPSLSLDLNPAHRQSGAFQSGRQQSAKFARSHNIVHKDYYRAMKADTYVNKQFDKKKSQELGRVPKKSLIEIKNSKYKQIGELISEQYSRSQIPEARLYMIDKVVRMRGQHGRFGIDHSELLNYELEQTNKPRDDYMNLLVYKNEAQTTKARDFSGVAPTNANVSQILFNRLSVKDEERYSDYSQRSLLGIKQRSSSKGSIQNSKETMKKEQLSYSDWLKGKETEKRLKRKLISQAQNEIKEELLNVAKQERDQYENRTKAMNDWLMQKKIDEAEKIAHMRELDRREEMQKQLIEERHTNSYKEWMRLQSLKKKQTRKYNKQKQSNKDDVRARQLAEQEEAHLRRRREREQEMGNYDQMEGEGGEEEDEYQNQHHQNQNHPQTSHPLRYKQHQM